MVARAGRRGLNLASRRHLLRHPLLTALSILGIALGVAVVVAVDLANQSAQNAFNLSVERISGRVTHQLVGGSNGIPETLYVRLRMEQRIQQCAPVVEAMVELEGETLTLLGLDPLAERGFRQIAEGGPGNRVSQLLTRPDSLLIAAVTARRLGLSEENIVPLKIAGKSREVTLIGLMEHQQDAALDGLLVADIATVQQLIERPGRIDRVDLILSDSQVEGLRGWLPPGVRLVDAPRRNAGMARMSEAFQTNLTAMSLLALLVGGFLIYNTITFSVLQRRDLFGNLRIMGVTRGELARTLLGEVLVTGLIGTLIGLISGVLLGELLIKLVSRTINDLYFVLTISQLLITPPLLLKGLLLGILTTLLAAAGPVWEAAATRPQAVNRRSVIEGRSRRSLPWLMIIGLCGMATGLLLSEVPSRNLLLGFGGLFLLIAGYSLLVPVTITPAARLSAHLLQWGLGAMGKLAAIGVSSTISRTGPAIAALTLAVAATVGMGIMIDSFRTTVADWLQQTLRGDIYVTIPDSSSRRAGTPLPRYLADEFLQIPGVVELSMGRSVQVEGDSGPVQLLAITLAKASYSGFSLKGSPLPDLWEGFHGGRLVLVSEPYAYRHRLEPGDRIQLLTAEGDRTFTVGGIFFDYGSDQGLVVMDRAVYSRHWRDHTFSTIGLYLQPGSELQQVQSRVRKSLSGIDRKISVRANREILRDSLAVFDRTFTITRVLRLLVVGVAFIGILSALMALQLERVREHAILRALGMTPGQLTGQIGVQTVLMGLMAGILALPLGWLISDMLLQVINLRAFGWSLQQHLAPSLFLEAILLAVGAALAAALYPALRMSRVRPAEALRDE